MAATVIQEKIGPSAASTGTSAVTLALDALPTADSKVVVNYRYNTAKAALDLSADGWTLAKNDEILNQPSAAIYYRDVVAGAEASAQSFTYPADGQGNHNIANMFEIGGLEPGAPFDTQESATSTTSSKSVGPSVALTRAGFGVALFVQNGSNGGATGAPATGWTRSPIVDSRALVNHIIATATQLTATEQWATSRTNVAILVAWLDKTEPPPPEPSEGITVYITDKTTGAKIKAVMHLK